MSALRRLLECVGGLALLLVALLLAAPAAAQERILDYSVEVQVQADGAIEVVEHIAVRAEGEQIRRGIFRDFPTRYSDRYGNAVVVELEVLEVRRDGQPEPWFTEAMDNGVRINTGGDDLLLELPREVNYTLRYRTTRQLGFFEDHDELYWNAIGTGWMFPIESARVEVRLPVEVAAAELQLDGYSGTQGAREQAFRAEVIAPGAARWTLTQPLGAGEGLTIVLGFPKVIVTEPSGTQRIGWLLADNRGLLVALAGLVALLAYCVQSWRVIGRDPSPGVIIARYEPPKDRSPAELRFLRMMGYDTRCLTADLLSAAVAGALELECSKRSLFGQLWVLKRGPGDVPEAVPGTASSLLRSLLPAASETLELKKSSATASRMQAAIAAHTQALNARLHGSHFHSNRGSLVIAALIAAAGFGLGLATSGGHGHVAIFALGAVMVVVVMVFARLVKAPTAEGRTLLDEIEGLKLYLSVAERDELASLRGPEAPPQLDARRYEALLPYAIALDVEDAWTGKFTLAVGAAAAAAATAAIHWYRGGSFSDMGSLANAVGSGLNSSIASSSSPPGSSSGGGGGGSSGGGGGGGGGGGR